MKKNFIYLLLFFSLIAQAQVTPSYPTIKLTKTVEGVKQDSLLVLGTDKIVKHIPYSKISSVQEYATASALPVTGVAGKIYVVKNVNKIYRWNGVDYSELSAQNNIVRTLKILNTSLSGVGRIEQQICDYILALPADQRTIAETDSKWNVVITEPSLYNIDLTSSNWEGVTTASDWESQLLSVGGEIANVSNFTLENGRVRFNVETDVLELDLSNLYITDVGVIDIGGLQNLYLSDNQLTSFDPSIALPSGLQNLYLSYNQLTSFDPSIALPSGLLYLELISNQLTSFDPSIALPSGLLYLYLSDNQLTSFDPSIALPSRLQLLYLSSNQLTSFDPSIALPSGLLYLELISNQLTSFDPSIALPSGLLYLYLSDNQLTSFDPSIALPSGLLYLDLSSNQLTSFDPSITLPSGLQHLYLSNNQLTTISYTNAEAWANAQPVFTNPCNVYFGNNINSITGTNLESILLTKNCIIIP